MSTSSVSRWGTTALVVAMLGGLVIWLSLPWIKGSPPENEGVVTAPTPTNLPRDVDAESMLLRQADVPAGWAQDFAPTDDTDATRTCRGAGAIGRVGSATTGWMSPDDDIGQHVSVFESIGIFATEADAEAEVDRITRAGTCEATALNRGQGDYTYNYQRFHRDNASVSNVDLPLSGDESTAQTLTFDLTEGSGGAFRVYDDRVTMRMKDVTYWIDVTSYAAAPDADARALARGATNRVANPIPITPSPPLNGPVSPPPAD